MSARRPRSRLGWALLLPLATALACEGPLAIPVAEEGALQVGERRVLELRATRLDVRRFEKTLDRAELLKLPPLLRRELWLLDLRLDGTPTRPQLLGHAIAALRARSPEDPDLGPAEANLVRLLQMTPQTADLTDSSLAPLMTLSEQLGFDPGQLLADAMALGTTEPFLGASDLERALLEGVVSTHPEAASRPGRVDAEHPDGRWPVPVGALPIMLEDVLSDMRTLSARFGPHPGGHPGFLMGETVGRLLGPDFALTVRVNLNALPFKGVALARGAVASVNSIGAEPDGLFDFADPDWLRMEGLEPGGPVVSLMRFALLDAPERPPVASTPVPWPSGDGGVWALPPWSLPAVVARAGVARWGDRDALLAYTLGLNSEPVATLSLVKGWLSADTLGELGDPPPPTYLWDVLVEVAHLRMRDGLPPASPGAPAEPLPAVLPLYEVPVGLTEAEVAQQVRDNLAQDASGLVRAARYLFDNSSGEADFFYLRLDALAPPLAGDWLAWVAPFDVPVGPDGAPVRDVAAHPRPGFFRDPGLTQPADAPRALLGGVVRRMVRVEPGDVLYASDAEGRRFRVTVGPKRGKYQCTLELERQ